jgi:hypothetical protein
LDECLEHRHGRHAQPLVVLSRSHLLCSLRCVRVRVVMTTEYQQRARTFME